MPSLRCLHCNRQHGQFKYKMCAECRAEMYEATINEIINIGRRPRDSMLYTDFEARAREMWEAAIVARGVQ